MTTPPPVIPALARLEPLDWLVAAAAVGCLVVLALEWRRQHTGQPRRFEGPLIDTEALRRAVRDEG